MNSSFYPKLALTNIKKNRKAYIPYMFTCVLTIMMFYVMYGLTRDEGIDKVLGSVTLRTILMLASIVVAIFAVIFLFYTNSFLMKQRKKEIGLYNVLGMGKRHIAKMMVWESVFIAVVTLAIGILGGILFGKLVLLLLLKLLSYSVALTFHVSQPAIIATLFVFGIIFIITLLFNLFQIRLSNPIELLNGGNQGEREPKTKWLLTVFGFCSLLGGYYIAQTTKSPLEAVGMFFVAVILVILGTYALFVAGSITLLKALRKNKKFYYKATHFTSVAGMIYRMKQNAVGLGNICILSTVVLVMVSTTVSLRLGIDDALMIRYPNQVHIGSNMSAPEDIEKIETLLEDVSKNQQVTVKNQSAYHEISIAAKEINKKDKFGFANAIGATGAVGLFLIPVSDYNKMFDENIFLERDEALVYSADNKGYGFDTFTIGNQTLKVVKDLKGVNLDSQEYMLIKTLYVFVADETVMKEIGAQKDTSEYQGMMNSNEISYTNDFDLSGTDSHVEAAYKEIKQRISDDVPNAYVEIREDNRQEFLNIYGGLLFIGIFLGILFLMATVLIIYYKQISEGLDDQKRFAIMQKVGMSQKEVKKTIKSQVLTVFFMPLVAAYIHIAVAFKVITLLLRALNLTNQTLFLQCTIGTAVIFAVFYAIVYALTAKEYYKIVK